MTTPIRVPRLLELNQDASQRRLGSVLGRRPDAVQDPYQWRMGTVVSPLIDTLNYNVQCSADGITRTMPSVAEYAPQVGDSVWVAQMGPSYVLVDLRSGPVRQAGKQTFVFSSNASVSASVVWPVSFPGGVVPVVLHSVEVPSNLDILSNMTAAPTNTGASFRLFQRALSTVSGTAVLHWEVSG